MALTLPSAWVLRSESLDISLFLKSGIKQYVNSFFIWFPWLEEWKCWRLIIWVGLNMLFLFIEPLSANWWSTFLVRNWVVATLVWQCKNSPSSLWTWTWLIYLLKEGLTHGWVVWIHLWCLGLIGHWCLRIGKSNSLMLFSECYHIRFQIITLSCLW